jgi:hypothetical protein
MKLHTRLILPVVVFILCSFTASAQNKPIGYWRSHLPYAPAIGVATDGTTVYTICNQAFFTLNGMDPSNSAVPYSKVEGMSDVGMRCVAYDKTTGTAILVYTNGNIDLFKENESTFYNVPDLKIKSISGSKSVSMVYAENGFAYLSTSLGVIVLNLATHNISETYQFNQDNQTVPAIGFIGNGNYFYALTSTGLFRAEKNNPQLQNFHVWQQLSTNATYKNIASVNNTIYISSSRSVYALIADSVQKVYTCSAANTTVIQHIDSGANGLLISEFYADIYLGYVKTMGTGFQLTDSIKAGNPVQAVPLADGSIWVADNYYGLGGKTSTGPLAYYAPPGPSAASGFDIYAHNKNVWVAHGGYGDDLYASNIREGVSNFNDEKWKIYKPYVYGPFDTLQDFASVVKNETTGDVYMGSYVNGLFTLHPDGSYELLNANSIFDTSHAYFGHNNRQIIGMALDDQNNLWVTLVYSLHQLYAKTPDGTWYKFMVPSGYNGGPLAFDDYGQVWFASLGSSGGVIAYNYNNTLGDVSDDAYYHFSAGAGNGNLPSNKVFCIAKDKNNSIWVGTDDGICIISNCAVVANSAPCDAQIPIVQYDQFAGYLFAGNTVKTIAVDGANRKWVGTNDGVWLLSSDAQKIVYRFTAENSPLPSNHIKKISIDKVTGDVYISTEEGLISYHSTATEGDVSNSNVTIFPNPVPSGYTGTIAIKGLVANADVRITDIDGQLVYKTTALGGQAVWNGKDYKGQRPQSGVYLVFVTNNDGSQVHTGKIVFMQ